VTERSLPEKIVAIDHALHDASIEHAFGGALALAYYGEPRATVDIDVNLFVSTDRLAEVIAALAPLGVVASADEVALRRDGQTRWWWGRTPVDLFFAHDAIHDAMREAVRNGSFGETEIPILAPEHLVVCKAVFDRPKDWPDIVQVLVSVDGFDVVEVRRWLDRLLAIDDQRREHFDALAAETLGR
jgi:nucleotidyltransferase AbiEii toxin of type IV toxin-antitoxin system